jgi:hypothetical protein
MQYAKSIFLAFTMMLSAALATAGEPAGTVIARLEYISTGCFHHTRGLMQLIQTEQGVVASLTYQNSGLKSEQNSFETRLTEQQLRTFQTFVNELKALKEETGCTSTTSYFLTTKEGVIRKKDGSCSWNGFYHMTEALFPGQRD